MSKHVLAAIPLALVLAAPAKADPVVGTPTPTVTTAVIGPAVHRVQIRAIVNVLHVTTHAAIVRAPARQHSESRSRARLSEPDAGR